jgi:hypothetical protein
MVEWIPVSRGDHDGGWDGVLTVGRDQRSHRLDQLFNDGRSGVPSARLRPRGREAQCVWRHGEWVDGVMFGLIREDLDSTER